MIIPDEDWVIIQAYLAYTGLFWQWNIFTKCSKIPFAEKYISQMTHMDKEKVWYGDIFTKLIFSTRQKNAIFAKTFHRYGT